MSHDTARLLAEVLITYVKEEDMPQMLADLEGIRGNGSYRATVVLLRQILLEQWKLMGQSEPSKQQPTFRPKFDLESEGMVKDYCEAAGRGEMTAIVIRATREYILKHAGRNEGVREKFAELQLARAMRHDAGAPPISRRSSTRNIGP